MNSTALLRILFRWKKLALGVGLLSLIGGLVLAWKLPLLFEAETMIERKPARLNAVSEDKEFDMIRLTSEMKRTTTFIKSRFLMEKWLETLSLSAEEGRAREKRLNELERSVIVKPINYTDVVSVKVRASSTEEATRRLTSLIQVFLQLDQEQSRRKASQLINLLKIRMEKVQKDMTDLRQEWLQYQKARSLRLSDSIDESKIQTALNAHEKLYDSLTLELEEAERLMEADYIGRLDVLTPPSASLIPVRSRRVLFLIAIAFSIFITGLSVFAAEWQDPSIRRAGDVYREISPKILATLPKMKNLEHEKARLGGALHPIVEAICHAAQSQKGVVVQLTSLFTGDGKTTVSALLAPLLRQRGLSCLSIVKNGSEIEIEKHRQQTDVLIVEVQSQPDLLMGSYWLKDATMTGIVLSSGRTPYRLLKMIEKQCERFTHSDRFYLLNQAEDPLPSFFKART